MSQSKIDLTEMFAEHIVELDLRESGSACESFAEVLAYIINDNLPENVEVTDSEWECLTIKLEDFVKDNLADDAFMLVDEWDESARELEEARRSAMCG